MHVLPVHLHIMLPTLWYCWYQCTHTHKHTHNSHCTSVLFPSQTIQSLYTNKHMSLTATYCHSTLQQPHAPNWYSLKKQTVCSQQSAVYKIMSADNKELHKAKQISQSLSTLRTTKQYQKTLHFQLNLQNQNAYVGALYPLYDTSFYGHRIALFTQQHHKSSHDPSDDTWRTSNFLCCCFLHNLSPSSTGFRSYLTFANSLFIKHCQDTIFIYTTVTLPELVGTNLLNTQHSTLGWQLHCDVQTTDATHNVDIKNMLHENSYTLIKACNWMTELLPSVVKSVKCKLRHIDRSH
jgi:hypothetical protein